LLSGAWDAQRLIGLVSGDWDGELMWAERRIELLDRLVDPDSRADVLATVVPAYLRRARFDDAGRMARMNDELTRPLTPHHRVHGVAVLLEVDEARSAWEEICELDHRAEETVADNLATPCVRNARALLVCAMANAYLGREERAQVLEEHAEAVALDGYGHILDTPRLRLALARGDLARVEELCASPPTGPRDHVVGRTFVLLTLVGRLEGLAALRDRARVESEAPPLLGAGPYLEPFALRALAVVRSDERLLADALARFEALGLAWEAERTRSL
jgi:hypothetical protein